MGNIVLSDLFNRINDVETKKCISFEYNIPFESNNGKIINQLAMFKRITETDWSIQTVVDIPELLELKVYKVIYQIPTPNLDLVKVATMGLLNLQEFITVELQYKNRLAFAIGDTVYGQ